MHLLMVGLLALEGAIAEPDARALVDKWLAAQNAGDFSSYDKLFATKFTGVRRSGPRTVRFDRAGWMKDRGRMFGKPMKVGIADLKVKLAGPSALVSFTQSFAQGSYKDAGPKQLVVVRESGALKIASEKMLRSELLSRPVPKDERFRFAVEGALLLHDSPDENWATGAISVDTRDPVVAARKVDAKRLPPEIAAWNGRTVRLVDAKGTPCEAKVMGFRMLSRSVPHFGTRQEWSDLKEKEVARQAWELGQKALVADVDKPCKDARWGQPAEAAPAKLETGEDTDGARALAELRKSDAWKAIQKSYAESPQEGVRLWDELKGVNRTVQRFRVRKGGKDATLISLTLDLWEGCGDFQGDLWGLYEERGDKLILRNTIGEQSVKIVGAVDSDADGNSELLFEPVTGDFGTEKGRLLLDGEKWNTVEKIAIPYMDCPC